MEPIGALRAGFAQGNRRRERQGADRAIKRLDSPGCEVHVATMTAAQAPAMVANPLFDTEDPEMIREVLRRLARRLNTVAPSPEATRPRTPRRRSPGSSLPALVAACRQLLRMAKEIGALSSPEVAQAKREFAETALAACQRQADALCARRDASDSTAAELCSLARRFVALVRTNLRLQRDLDQASRHLQTGAARTAQHTPLSRRAFA